MPAASTVTSETIRNKLVQAALQTAKDAAGKPYAFGGKTTAGFDCSGFVAYVYEKVIPEYGYLNTGGIRDGGRFREVPSALPGDLIFFPKGTNPYEVKRKNNREFEAHVGIVIDDKTWIGSQSSTGVALVRMQNPWWSARPYVFLRYKGLPPV